MRFLKIFFASLAIFLINPHTYAQDGEVHYTSSSFITTGRKVAVRGADAMSREQISERMAQHGAIVYNDIFSQIFLSGVTLRFKKDINGHSTAYTVEVTKNAIKIQYTSLEMLEIAIHKFYRLFSEVSGVKVIRGCSIIYYADANSSVGTIPNNANGIYDGVTFRRSHKKVESAMRSQFSKGNKSFIFAMVNSNIFRVNFNVFEGINPKAQHICDPKSYTFSDIQKFKQIAERMGGEFIPAIDLLSDNDQFKRYTGHCIYTAEGMRFVRAMIEECANNWGVKSLYIGTQSDCTATNGYIDFIKDIANRNSIKIIFH